MKIGIIGLGLIGGSIGKAAVRRTAHTIYGYDLNEEVVKTALDVGAIHCALEDISELDMLIVALREGETIKALENYCPKLKDGAIVIDTCGNKRGVVSCMEKLKKLNTGIHFVGVHPMAGREYSGIAAATDNLFEGAYVVAVPVAGDLAATDIVKDFFVCLGAKGIKLSDADTHDKTIAYTSQLAHIVSSSYIKNPLSTSHLGYSAGSYGDLTRVARLDPDMWTELFINNRDYLAGHIGEIISKLIEYKEAIAASDKEELHRLLVEGAKAKEASDRSEDI